jgi:hypothetical protein
MRWVGLAAVTFVMALTFGAAYRDYQPSLVRPSTPATTENRAPVRATSVAARDPAADATAVSIIAIYINTCDTPLSAKNEKQFNAIKAVHSYTDNQGADALVHNMGILAKIGKQNWCPMVTKMLQEVR